VGAAVAGPGRESDLAPAREREAVCQVGWYHGSQLSSSGTGAFLCSAGLVSETVSGRAGVVPAMTSSGRVN